MTAVILAVLCAPTCPRGTEARAAKLGVVVALAARVEHVRPSLLASLVAHESSARWRTSRAGALGYAQVMPSTAGEVCRGLRWQSVAVENVRCGARILREYLRRCGGSELLAVGAYNSGHCAPSPWARSVLKSAEVR